MIESKNIHYVLDNTAGLLYNHTAPLLDFHADCERREKL